MVSRVVLSILVYHGQSGKYLHHNYVSTLLNDLFGIQSRGGCACAGPYAMVSRVVLSILVYHGQSGKYLHHNYVSTLLNDLFGIQSRGGCACAGPYAMVSRVYSWSTMVSLASTFTIIMSVPCSMIYLVYSLEEGVPVLDPMLW